MKGELGYLPTILHYSDQNGYKIKGEINLVNLPPDENPPQAGVWGDIYYGYQEHHFEGFMTLFYLQPHIEPIDPIDPIDPVYPTDPDPEEDITDVVISSNDSRDIFPYIYLHRLTQTTDADYTLRFITYTTPQAQTSSLYLTLAQLKQTAAPDARQQMTDTCAQFIQGNAPWANQYYTNLQNVPAPFAAFPALYDLLIKEMRWEPVAITEAILIFLEKEKDQLTAWLQSSEYIATKDQLWQNYFALTVLQGYNELFAIEINKILLICHLLEQLLAIDEPAVLQGVQDTRQLLQSTIILPDGVFPLPPATTIPAGPGYILPAAIGMLQMVKQKLAGYAAGEVSRIDNVLRGEKKEIRYRRLKRTNDIQQENYAQKTGNSNDNKEFTTDLQREAQQLIADITRTTTYNNFQTTYGPPTQATLNGSWSEEIKPTTTVPATDTIQDFAKKILNKTASRITERVIRLRETSQLSETEESTFSVFNNTSGNTNFRGIYRWLNKIYKAWVVNYGYRLVLELVIDNPAGDYIRNQENIEGRNLRQPIDPVKLGITDFTKITAANYATLSARYDAQDVTAPPPAVRTATVALRSGELNKIITVPQGYTAATAFITCTFAPGTPTAQMLLNGVAGRNSFSLPANNAFTTSVSMNGEDDAVSLSVVVTEPAPNTPPVSFVLSAGLQCNVSDKLMANWQIQTYNSILSAYQRQKALYYEYMKTGRNSAEESNPALNRDTERNELTTQCRQLLQHNAAQQTGIPADAAGIDTPNELSFLNEAFEWREMSYSFDEHIGQQAAPGSGWQQADESLRPFLQAARARVWLPVTPRFNYQVLYYLSAGIVWMGEWPFVPVNKNDAVIANALKDIEGWEMRSRVSKPWKVIVPTPMQVLQESQALPVFEEKMGDR
jgi:hypothetical protein